MSEMDDMLIEPFRRLLADVATPAAVRLAERTAGVPPLWSEIEASGFLDALLPEERGGAGLRLADVFPLVAATGEFALPAPFAETMVARALLASRGAEPPAGAAIVLAPPSAIVPLAGAATHALLPREDRLVLVAIGDGGIDPFGTGGRVIDRDGAALLSVAAGTIDLSLFAAGLAAAKMAGAMVRLLDMTIGYSGERQQFGRTLGKFQAIQHNLAVMAEQVASASVAARIGMSGAHFDPARVALAKCRTSEASHQIVGIAHAVHGAIGATEEYDLQLYTRRLKEWQIAFGSESHWAVRLARARLASGFSNGADFVRVELQDVEDIA